MTEQLKLYDVPGGFEYLVEQYADGMYVLASDHAAAVAALEKERDETKAGLACASHALCLCGERCDKTEQGLDAALARLAEAERDAERYRYIRKRITGASVADGRHTMTIEFPVGVRLWINPDGFDTTVDAALSQEKRGE